MSATVLVVLFVVGALATVAIHELGHFATARMFRMAVSDFSVGFGKPLLTVRRRGITYRLRLLPLGGFVKIHGMRPGDKMPEEPNGAAYVDRPAWQRFVVAAAGPGANVLFAWILLFLVVLALPFEQLATRVAHDTAAAGLRAGDEVVAINATPIASGDQLAAQLDHVAGPFTVELARGGSVTAVELTETEPLVAALGRQSLRLPPKQAMQGATVLVGALAHEQASGLSKALAPTNLAQTLSRGFAGETRNGANGEVMSVVGLGRAVAQQGNEEIGSAGHAALWLLLVLAALNLVLALFNLIPVTPLDGGHAALALVEGSVSAFKRLVGSGGDWFLPRPLVSGMTLGAFTLLVALGVSLITLDIVNPIRLQG